MKAFLANYTLKLHYIVESNTLNSESYTDSLLTTMIHLVHFVPVHIILIQVTLIQVHYRFF